MTLAEKIDITANADEELNLTATQPNFERLELKYLIDEVVADRIRRQISGICSADRHSTQGRRAGSNSYVINSLYLDAPGLAFHEAKERGDPERVKLRVRTYSADFIATLDEFVMIAARCLSSAFATSVRHMSRRSMLMLV